jgi:ribose 5-phosphate isomerase A
MIVIIDETKLVNQLGAFPVAVEISPFLYQNTVKQLKNQGYSGFLRLNKDQNFYKTDNGNYIFDIHFSSPIIDPVKEHKKIKEIAGVLETGLFFDLAGRIIIGYQNGVVKIVA